MREFGGLTSDDWLNVATFAGPFLAALVGGFLAVWFAAGRIRAEQEARDIRTYLLDEGALALKQAIDSLLELTRQNFAVATHLIYAVRNTPQDHPLHPRAADISTFLRNDLLRFNFHAIGPTSRLLGFPQMGDLATHAFAALYQINVVYEFNVRQPVVRYYEGADWSHVKIEEWCEKMESLTKENYLEAEEYRFLSNWLSDAVLRAQELHLAKSKDIGRIQEDETVRGLVNNMKELLQKIRGRYDDQP